MNKHTQRMLSLLITGFLAISTVPLCAVETPSPEEIRMRVESLKSDVEALHTRITPPTPAQPKEKTKFDTFKDYYGLEASFFVIPAAITYYLAHQNAKPEKVAKDLENARMIQVIWSINERHPFTFQEVREAYALASQSKEQIQKNRNKAKLPLSLMIGGLGALWCFAIRHTDPKNIHMHAVWNGSYGSQPAYRFFRA